jgi:hypothetical protein
LLRTWDEAAGDLHAASNIEYDDEISVVLKVDYRFTMYVSSLCDSDLRWCLMHARWWSTTGGMAAVETEGRKES